MLPPRFFRSKKQRICVHDIKIRSEPIIKLPNYSTVIILGKSQLVF